MPETLQSMYCPNCARQIFRYRPSKAFHIEILCSHCKAIYDIENKTDGTISHNQVREPRYANLPKERKSE